MTMEKAELVEVLYQSLEMFASHGGSRRARSAQLAERWPDEVRHVSAAFDKLKQRAETEQMRVADLVRAMGEYEDQERRIAQAQIAFENGNTACLDETIIAPTPELLASGEFVRFNADTVKGTVRSAATVRRKLMSHVVNFHVAGVIDEAQLQACRWYKDVYEATGLTGNIPSTDYTKEVFSAPQSRSMFSDWQIDMQDMWRAARSQMTPRWLPFFDAVVLHDVSPRSAIRLAKKRNGTETGLFRDVVVELAAAYDTLKKQV